MRLVVQRSGPATVTVKDKVVGRIDFGIVVLVGVKRGDNEETARQMAEKVAGLRIFEDESGKMNEDIMAVNGGILSVSQFTLYGDVRKGRRPNYMQAAGSDEAIPVYEAFNQALAALGIPVQTGDFGAMMQVQLVNDGPVTILLDSDRVF